jgi:hypothetical protein
MPEESDDVMRLAEVVAKELHVTASSLFGGSKSKSIVRARQVLAYFLREQGCSYPEIAAKVGYKDHTSAMSATNAILNKGDNELTAHLRAIRNELAVKGSLPNLVRVALPRPIRNRLRVLLRSGCYGTTMEEVVERLLGSTVYRLVKDVDTAKEES